MLYVYRRVRVKPVRYCFKNALLFSAFGSFILFFKMEQMGLVVSMAFDSPPTHAI